jgi:hypothetical protein
MTTLEQPPGANAARPRLKLTAALQDILQKTVKADGGPPLTLGFIVETTHERSFAVILAFLCLPFLTPLPLPGLSTPFGIAVLLLGAQLAIRKHRPWLPQRLLNWRIPPRFGARLIGFVAKLFRPLEWIIRPRLGFMQNAPAMVLVGIALVFDGALLSLPLPIPFSNAVPAWFALIKILGITEEDGVALMGGTVLSLGAVAAVSVGIGMGMVKVF